VIEPETVLRRAEQVRYRLVEREAVVILQAAGEAVVLSEVGARILDLLDGETPVSAWIDRLLQEYEVERPSLERDVLEFLGELCELGVAEPVVVRSAG
jgi:hypothetical protein